MAAGMPPPSTPDKQVSSIALGPQSALPRAKEGEEPNIVAVVPRALFRLRRRLPGLDCFALSARSRFAAREMFTGGRHFGKSVCVEKCNVIKNDAKKVSQAT